MTSDFLERVSFEHAIKKTSQGTAYPRMIEVGVNPALAPFLVSSTRGALWVPQASRNGTVRGAVRGRTGLEQDLLHAVVSLGIELEWGNIKPFTAAGLTAAAQHLQSYGLEEIEVLVSPSTGRKNLESAGLNWVESDWVPIDAAVVLPIDRSFVGVEATLGPERVVAVVHNASRGVGVAWNVPREMAKLRTGRMSSTIGG